MPRFRNRERPSSAEILPNFLPFRIFPPSPTAPSPPQSAPAAHSPAHHSGPAAQAAPSPPTAKSSASASRCAPASWMVKHRLNLPPRRLRLIRRLRPTQAPHRRPCNRSCTVPAVSNRAFNARVCANNASTFATIRFCSSVGGNGTSIVLKAFMLTCRAAVPLSFELHCSTNIGETKNESEILRNYGFDTRYIIMR